MAQDSTNKDKVVEMGIYKFETQNKVFKVKGKSRRLNVLKNEEFDDFKPAILGLGRINQDSKEVDAIAAVFDLSGFTKFCSKADPHLRVPKYLNKFLYWLFAAIRGGTARESIRDYKALWTELPFLAKFLGDGVLFLWDTKRMAEDEDAICNVPVMVMGICDSYRSQFYPRIGKSVVDPPKILRCGIARGKIYSVGKGEDYVGACINRASRLQKLGALTFCCNQEGFDFDKHMRKNVRKNFLKRRVSLRGIGNNELVWVLKDEFEELPPEEKDIFRKPSQS